MLAAARGDLGEAVALLDDALRRCARQRDTHRWIRAFVSDALCAVGIRGGDARAGAWAADLAAFAGAGGMAEFSVRAYLYRAELGDPEALEAARTLMVGVESPRMDAAVRAGASPLVADLVALGS
jgi:hypothetical protein